MKRIGLLVLAVGLVLLLTSTPVARGSGGGSVTLTVYADGYVHVSQAFAVDPKATSIQVPLLSAAVSDLVATDQSGSPLSYGFGPGGNITVYTLGASSVDLGYDTSSITSKNGTIWTLAFETIYNSTVFLPPLSTLSSASGTPYSINESGTSTELALPEGSWRISYGVPFTDVSSTGSTSGVGTSQLGAGQLELGIGGGVVVVAAAAVTALALRWRRQGGHNGGELRPDDRQVLAFIREKGGRVLEPEIRTRFALPKTSAWRQIKRLERMGYVKVTKAGSQNQIELQKDRGEA